MTTPTMLLQWGHGDEAVEESNRRRPGAPDRYRFNGATAMKPWKSLHRRFSFVKRFKLQWGHGDEAVEEHARKLRVESRAEASMGPRR